VERFEEAISPKLQRFSLLSRALQTSIDYHREKIKEKMI
jgi:hypothetical protein